MHRREAFDQIVSVMQEALAGDDGGSGFKGLLDKVLIADFFFVCLALLWLGAGVVSQALLDSKVCVLLSEL